MLSAFYIDDFVAFHVRQCIGKPCSFAIQLLYILPELTVGIGQPLFFLRVGRLGFDPLRCAGEQFLYSFILPGEFDIAFAYFFVSGKLALSWPGQHNVIPPVYVPVGMVPVHPHFFPFPDPVPAQGAPVALLGRVVPFQCREDLLVVVLPLRQGFPVVFGTGRRDIEYFLEVPHGFKVFLVLLGQACGVHAHRFDVRLCLRFHSCSSFRLRAAAVLVFCVFWLWPAVSLS